MAEEVPSDDGVSIRIIAGVLIHKEVVGGSSGKSSRYSKARAAAKAVTEIEGLPPYEFRKRYGCDCDLLGGSASGEDSATMQKVL